MPSGETPLMILRLALPDELGVAVRLTEGIGGKSEGVGDLDSDPKNLLDRQRTSADAFG